MGDLLLALESGKRQLSNDLVVCFAMSCARNNKLSVGEGRPGMVAEELVEVCELFGKSGDDWYLIGVSSSETWLTCLFTRPHSHFIESIVLVPDATLHESTHSCIT